MYDEAGNVIETHEHAGDFKEWCPADWWSAIQTSPRGFIFSIAASTFWQASVARGNAFCASSAIFGNRFLAFFDPNACIVRNPSIPCKKFQSANREPRNFSSQLTGSLRYISIPRT